MEDSSDQWVVRTTKDQVKGPYKTEVLRKMIVSGLFNGTEEICQYPQGEWQVLTKQPEFYEALLESLENPSDVDNKKSLKMEAETVVKPSPASSNPQKKAPIPKFDLKEFVENELKAEQDLKARRDGEKQKSKEKTKEKPKENQAVVAKPNASGNELVASANLNAATAPLNALPAVQQEKDLINSRDNNLEIQMVDLKKLKQREWKKLLPLFLLLALLVGAATYVFLEEEPVKVKGWALLAPQKDGETLSDSEVKELKRNAARAFQTGVIDHLLVAQNELLKAVEGAPRDLEAMGFLCMAYHQLWSYTKQSEQDLKSILTTTQMARSINPISNYSESCQATYLLSKGQIKEGKSLIERTLDNNTEPNFLLTPFLYYIKAELLEYETNYINAEAYYDQASKTWEPWVAPRFGKARMLMKQNKFSEARIEFEKILKDNSDSKMALYGLALVELKTTRDLEKAINYFSNGHKIKEKMHKDFHAEALLNYAKLLADKNETKNALAVAEEGFKISPSNRNLKELVLSLGGDDKIDNTNPEVILVGDQFARAGDHMTAQAQYKAAFELNPKSSSAAYKAAKSLWVLNQTREAINWLEKAITADPDYLQAYILKADYESQKYNFLGAQKTLSTATNRFNQSHELSKAMALLEFRKNNMYGTVQFGERAMRMYDADVELLTLLAQAYIYIYLNSPSTSKEEMDKKEDAKKMAQTYAGRAIDLEPALPETQITYAKFLAADKGPVREEIYLKELIKAYPYTLEYRIALAEFYKEYEKYTESAKVYEEVVLIDPKHKKANFGLAECYRVLNKVELAQKFYNITSVLDPSDVEPMFSNAKLLIETATGREVRAKIFQALAKLELVRQINPDFPKVSFFIARCHLELGNYDEALKFVKEEKSKNPNIADSYILAAELYSRNAKFKDCAAEYAGAIKLRPNSGELYVKAAACYRNSDSIEIAEDMLQMAQERESGLADIYREFGYVYEKKGQPSAAVLFFEKYLVLSPNASDRDAVNADIKRLGGGK